MASSVISSPETSAATLNARFYLNHFYKYNRSVTKASGRNDFHLSELSYEDSRALKRAVSKLSSFDYDQEKVSGNLLNAINAFVETYNFALDSSSPEDRELLDQNEDFQELTQKYSKELKAIGISIKDNGKISINQDSLKNASSSELEAVFGKDSDYMKGLRRISRRMNNNAYDEVYARMTGCGGRLNIIL